MSELNACMSSRELAEWRVFDRHEPVGDRRLDWLAAYLVQSMIRMRPSRKKTRKIPKLHELLLFGQFWRKKKRPSSRPSEQPQPVAIMREQLKALAAAHAHKGKPGG